MADIQVKKTGEEPGAASLAVTVPPEHVREAEERATADYQRRARLPGFRRGKAPAAIVKKQLADDIQQQALQELIRERWSIALEQETLKAIADPHIHNLKWETAARAPSSSRASWAFSPGRRSTPSCASPMTSPTRRSGARRATSG